MTPEFLFLAHTLASLHLDHEPKARVATFNLKLKLCALEKTYSPTMASCERP